MIRNASYVERGMVHDLEDKKKIARSCSINMIGTNICADNRRGSSFVDMVPGFQYYQILPISFDELNYKQ